MGVEENKLTALMNGTTVTSVLLYQVAAMLVLSMARN
jgi:hypothetical protein